MFTLPSLAGATVNHTAFQILIGSNPNQLIDLSQLAFSLQLQSLHYCDPISFEADTLELVFSDIKDQIINNNQIQKGIWLRVIIHQLNRDYPGSQVQRDLGFFMVDQIKQTGPPTQTTIMASALPIHASIKTTLKNKVYFDTSLKSLLERVAKENKLTPVFEADVSRNIPLSLVEQWNESDLQFLAKICKRAGLALKVHNRQLIAFDEQAYEQNPAVYTIDFGKPGAGIGMTHWELTTQSQDVYRQIVVACFDPYTNQLNMAQADDPGGTTNTGEVLMVYDLPLYAQGAAGEDIAT